MVRFSQFAYNRNTSVHVHGFYCMVFAVFNPVILYAIIIRMCFVTYKETYLGIFTSHFAEQSVVNYFNMSCTESQIYGFM